MAPWIGRLSKYKQSIAGIVFIFSGLAHGLSFSVSGASYWTQDTTDASSKSKVLVNAGYAIPSLCTTQDNVTTCNSCTGKNITNSSNQSVPAPCNEQSIYENLQFIVQVDSDNANINELTVGVAKATEYTANSIQGLSPNKVSGRTYALQATWSQVVAALGMSFTCTSGTQCGGTKLLYLGPIKDDKFVEYVTIEIKFSIINYSSSSSPGNGLTKGIAPICAPDAEGSLVSSVTSEGLCYYEMFPGDGKAYITNLIAGWGGSSPTDADTSLNYTNLVMYYAEVANGASEFDTLKSITNASSKSLVSLNNVDGDPLSDYKVGQLENGEVGAERKYCFVSALQDATGNIFYFLDVQKIHADSSTFDVGKYGLFCASPSEVVGVLSDKDCFIATVAFGSRHHPFLDILREFRNTYMHPHPLGKKFIKLYYTYGPQWAKRVSEYPVAKVIVKIGLLPVVGLTYLILNPLWFVVLGSLLAVGYVYRRRRGVV
ncbi:MAG: hypothetical protein JNL11_17925 [Bdellovibrionaceae bacterium]|nr:hypothetical protein [Pseudobdellovibrionaceae bacterium]